jgi:hypothetical protein
MADGEVGVRRKGTSVFLLVGTAAATATAAA